MRFTCIILRANCLINFSKMIVDMLDYIYGNHLPFGLLGLLLSALLSTYFVPAIRQLAKSNNFTDTPSARKSHSLQVPILGGVAVYLSAGLPMAIYSIFFNDLIVSNNALILGFCSLTLLFVGVKDDINGLKPITKLIFQLFTAALVLYTVQLNIENMNGILGLFELPKVISILLSIFVYVIFMNMLNLIDGIDGLASGLSLIAFTFFAYISYSTGNVFTSIICMSAIGGLLPFIYYNMFSVKKIFLGDNGSLTLGFMLGFISLELLSAENYDVSSLLGLNTPLVLMSLFSFPLVDTLRVFTIRVLRKRSPFSADKNHVHHHLLRLGLSHRFATLLILVYTILITILSCLLLELNINFAFVVLLPIAVFCICLPVFLERRADGSIQFRH